ncbi:MAG TPA: hypothetical protein VKA15_04380, partial [Isosphaeraceae bacterium]|nr:hypothetical protein [Isosphaeraceae bacterium]
LSGQLLSHLVDRNPTGAPRPSKLVATIDLSADPTADVVLTGVFAVPNHLQFVPATGPATYAHSVAVYVDQANMPSESVFLGLFSASAQPIAAIVEHQLTLPDNTIRTWQVPQMLRPVAIPAALSADPALLGFDAGAVLLLRASVDDSATPGSQGPPTIERPGFMSLRLVPRLVGRFEPSRGINILELRLPALLALKATGTPPSIKVPAHPIAPTAPGSFRFITAGTQPPTTDPGPDVSSPTVQFIRRDPLARYLRADVLAGAIGPTSGQPWSKPTYRENSKLLFLPTILPELAAVGGLGQKVLDAGFVVSAPPLAGGSLVLTRPLVIEAAVTVTQDAGSTVAARRRLDASLCVDAQLGAFIARDLVLVAHDRVDSDLIGWGQQQLAPLRTSDGGIVVSDFAEVTAIPAPPESGARDGVWGHQAPAPDQPLIVGATDSRSALPGAGFAPTVPAAFCGLAEFDAGPSPANDRGQCISGVRHRLAPTWEGQYWRVQPVELLAAGAAQFATLLKAPQNPQRQAVRDALPSTSDFGTVLTVLAAGTGSNAEATILARELNLLIQADGTFAVIQADSPPPHDYNARFRARREALSVLFGDTLPPPAGQRRFANRFRPARTVSGMANVLAVTHDEQTPFVKDPYRTADLTLPMLTGVMQRSGPEAPSDPMPSLLPPLIDVVAWSARPGETGTDRWSVHEYVFPATGGTRARYGQSQQAVASLRRPRARAGRDEKIDLQCFPSKPLFSNRFIFTKFNLKQTLGESVIPDSVAQKPFAAINAVGVDRTHFQAAVKDVRLAPTCPVIFLYEGTSAAPKVQDVAIFLVVNPHYQARSDKSVKLLLSNGTVTPPITVPDLRTFLCFNLGGTIGNLPIALPFASPPTPEDMLQNPPPPYVNPIADSNMLLEIPNPGTDASWLLLGDPAIAEQMSIPLDTDKAPASKIYTGGMPGSFALGVLTFRLDVGTAGSNGAVNPPSQWKWTQADPSAVPPATAQTELFIDFVNKAGSIIPPKMSAAILAWPGQLQGQADPDQSLVLAGYRLMDDRDFSPITPFPGDAPNLVAWVRQAALESLLRAPGQINDNATDPIYRFDIVVTGSSGELIPTNSIS